MNKRVISLLLIFCMLLSMFATGLQPVSAAESTDMSRGKFDMFTKAPAQMNHEDDTGAKEIDQSTYDALGLKLHEEGAFGDLTAPFSTENDTAAFVASEIYVAANGNKGNVYTLRDGLNRMDYQGPRFGGYGFYGISSSDIKGDNGNSNDSNLSQNTGKNLISKKSGGGFCGIYATSVAFNSGEGKDNFVAELRAYGNDAKTYIDGKQYDGKVEVEIFKIQDDGTRRHSTTLYPTVNKSMTFNNNMSYFTRRYVQELDAMFEIEATDGKATLI